MAAPGSGALAELLQLVDELGARLRREAVNLADVPQEQAARIGRELGFVRREELQALELRLAQLEHRLKLLEQP